MNRASGAVTDVDPNRSRWIPWAFVGGMGLVVVVNLGLVFAALSTFTGVTVGHAYDRGRTYNDVIAAAERQAALGWQARVTLDAGVLALAVTDREGLPVPGRLEGALHRPLERTRLPLDFAAVGPGRFLAAAPPLQAGQWEARLVLHGPGNERLDIRQRVMAP
jgi:nitrogen fixation protein FixH